MNKYAEISPSTVGELKAELLQETQAKMLVQRYGQPATLPKKHGDIMKWRRYHSFLPAVAPLQEGVTPRGTKLKWTDLHVQLKEYGDFVPLTTQVADKHSDPILQISKTNCAKQAAETLELVGFSALKSGTSVMYRGGVASRSLVAGAMRRGDILKIKRQMKRSRAETITSMIGPTAKVSTVGIAAAYIGFAHTDLEPDIANLSKFKEPVEYGQPNERIEGEFGMSDGIRYLTTDLLTPWEGAGADGQLMLSHGGEVSVDSAADVYPVLIIAKDAYGVVRLQGPRAVEMYILQPGQARGGDELGQRGSVGWKVPGYAVRILNDEFIWRYEVGCTADPS